jgi:hypothetical protein
MHKRSVIFKNVVILGLLLLGFASIVATGGGGGGEVTTGSQTTDYCAQQDSPQTVGNVTYKIRTVYKVEGEQGTYLLPNTKLTYGIYVWDRCLNRIIKDLAKDAVGYTESDGVFETTLYGVKLYNPDQIQIYGSSEYDGPSPVDNYEKITSKVTWGDESDCVTDLDFKNKSSVTKEIDVVHTIKPCRSTVVTKLTITPTFVVKTYYQVQGENPQLLNCAFYMTIYKYRCGKSTVNFANSWLVYSGESGNPAGTYSYTVNPSQGTYYENSRDEIGITVEATNPPTGSSLPAGITRIDRNIAYEWITYDEAKNSSTGKITKQVNLILPAYRK